MDYKRNDKRAFLIDKAMASFKEGNTPWIIISFLIVILCIYVRIRLLNVPLERDEGEFAYMAQLMLKGIPPFASAYSLKIPGVFGVYALSMGLFGQSVQGIHSVLLVVNVLTILLVFLLCTLICDVRAGLIASSLYAILSISYTVLGVFAHATHFVVLFALAGFVCLVIALNNRNRLSVLASGLMFGFAFTMKQHAAAFAFFALIGLVWEGFKLGIGRRNIVSFALLFNAGLVVPYLGWVLYLAAKGVFPQFWFWTVTYAAEYATNTTFPDGWLNFVTQFTRIVHSSGVIWLTAFILLVLLLAGAIRTQSRFFLIGLFLASFAAILPGYYFRAHYFIMMLPALSILIGAAVSAIVNASKKFTLHVHHMSNVFALFFVIFLCSTIIVKERQYLFYDTSEKVSKSVYTMKPFVESQTVAAYLKENTLPDDRIAVLGSEPEIFFYADRLSASGHICMYGLMEEQPFALQMQNQFIQEVEASNPKFIINVTDRSSWLPHPQSVQNIFIWAEDYLIRNYELVGLISIADTFTTNAVWGSDAQQRINLAPSELQIYRRRT